MNLIEPKFGGIFDFESISYHGFLVSSAHKISNKFSCNRPITRLETFTFDASQGMGMLRRAETPLSAQHER
jgi:hypothetical protein